MAKKQAYYAEAERLYVNEQMTLEAIAGRLGDVSVRTLQTWKTEYNWDDKRAQFLNGKEAFHSELYQFARKLMRSIEDDMDNGAKPDNGRLYTLTRILPMLPKVKNYEDVARAVPEDTTPLDGEKVVSLLREAMFNDEFE